MRFQFDYFHGQNPLGLCEKDAMYRYQDGFRMMDESQGGVSLTIAESFHERMPSDLHEGILTHSL